MSQLTDFLFIGMIGVGGMFIFFNWAEVQKWFGGGEVQGHIGPCTFDKRTAGEYHFCHTGAIKCGSVTCKTCTTRSDDPSTASGCLGVKIAYCNEHKNDTATCGGTTTPGCTPVNTGNCRYDCKGAFCWYGTYVVCSGGQRVIKSGSACIKCTSSDRAACCNAAKGVFLKAHPDPGTCTASRCPGKSGNCSWDCKNAYCWECLPPYCNVKVKKVCAVGPAPTSTSNINSGCTIAKGVYIKANGTQNTCNSSNSAAKMWIARCVASTIGRMAGRNPTNTQVYNGWQSLLGTLAVQNNCNQNSLHTSSAVFNKNYAKLILAVAQAYTITLPAAAWQATKTQEIYGQWKLAPWSPIGTFYTESGQPSPDTPYGYAYSTTLQQNGENRYDPYGDQRYSETVPANTMRVKVSN